MLLQNNNEGKMALKKSCTESGATSAKRKRKSWHRRSQFSGGSERIREKNAGGRDVAAQPEICTHCSENTTEAHFRHTGALNILRGSIF
jgi:hypothetical protein